MTIRAESENREARELDQRAWSRFFDDINKQLEAGVDIWTTLELVTQEIVGPQAERLPLDSITYEDGDDEIAIGLGGRGRRFPAVLWHFVEHPRRVWAMGEDDELSVIAIESEDGGRTLLHLREPPAQ